MNDVLATLNGEQRIAVEATEGPVLVLSGAGTGKTRVLTTRIAYILANKLARSWEILALTFTNKAANEMKARVAELGQVCEWCGTFHSICLRILRRNAAQAGLRQDFLIFGEDDQRQVLKTVLVAQGFDIKKYKPAEWVEKISFYKDAELLSGKHKSDEFNKIYAAYNLELERLGGIDFGDIINKTIKLLTENPEILLRYQQQFKYILVDEYQDTNAAQNLLLKLLSAGSVPRNICCVGDDDQSIYSWRGAEIKNILHFAKEYEGTQVIRLEQNYRSTSNILNAANSLIKNNKGRLGKDLHTKSDVGQKVKLNEHYSDVDEAANIAENILDRTYNGTKLSDFAILIRSGSLSRLYEEEFAKRGIAYRLVGAQKFYDRMEIRDVIAYVRLMCYEFDDISFLRVISRPRRGIGDVAIKSLREFAGKNNSSLIESLRSYPFKPKQRIEADKFIDAFDFNWSETAPAIAVQTLLERTGYIKMWTESNDSDASERLRNVNELIRNVVSSYNSLWEFLEQVSLMTADDERETVAESVAIMTIHAAKGLEFDTVFLPAWEEGIFPNEMAIADNGIEEERRLAYVAITRAKRHCIISYAQSRMLFGQFTHNMPSRFISEIDEQFIETARTLERERILKKQTFTTSTNMVGKIYDSAEFGRGVIIQHEKDHYIVAFKTGIKKLPIDN